MRHSLYSTGTVSGTASVHVLGGLVGANYKGGVVNNCYSTATVSGGSCVGGLVGDNDGYVTGCYSSGVVRGEGNVGGLVGHNLGSVLDSVWDMESSGLSGSAGGMGKTTAEMQEIQTYLNAGWDFVNVWGIGENQTYPYLRKYSAADINQDASVNLLDLAVLAENWLGPTGP